MEAEILVLLVWLLIVIPVLIGHSIAAGLGEEDRNGED